MRNPKTALQFTLFCTVLLSSALLGLAMDSVQSIVVASVGMTMGFLIADRLRWLQLDGMIANVVSIIVLVIAMRNFFSLDGTGKLTSVATLLSYLLTVLMFQEKTPRVNWQILVLSLLQVVLSTIFCLNLEAGMLFLCYFLVIGLATLLQSIYIQQFDIQTNNEKSALLANQWFKNQWFSNHQFSPTNQNQSASPALTNAIETHRPIVFFDSQSPSQSITILKQLLIWFFLSFSFAATLFHLAPRNSPPWFGPARIAKTSTAGVEKSVDLDERGKITLSNQVMFQAKFQSPKGQEVQPANLPYFRGLALSSVVVANGKTDFRAPYDRVSKEHYQLPRRAPFDKNFIIQNITVEKSADPLIYGVYPFWTVANEDKQITFCHEISGLTRCRLREPVSVSPFKFQAATLLGPRSNFSRTWPYVSNTRHYSQHPMADDPLQHEWLTHLEPNRYPELIKLSDQIAAKNSAAGGDRRTLIAAIENHFLNPRNFRYSLDYTDIQRDPTIDPIEDFVANFRTGHCEMFASAATLMLRRQGIPARLVVGYHAGEYNQLLKSFVVRGQHAHAWVEAYLPPEECTSEMLASGQSGPGGAWTIVEATPSIPNSTLQDGQNEAIVLARNVWDDYVLGNENTIDTSETKSPVYAWARRINLDIDAWEERANSAVAISRSPAFKYGIAALLALVILTMLANALRPTKNGASPDQQVGFFKRMAARAAALISPQLADWVLGKSNSQQTKFYDRMARILADQNLYRRHDQTHREFAATVATEVSAHPNAQLIEITVAEITAAYNSIRFGHQRINQTQRDRFKQQIDELKLAFEDLAIQKES